MRIAHLSDLHILDLAGVSPTRFFNKRLTGYANLRLRRGHHHRAAYVEALCQAIRGLSVDHVVITGDLTNLALESEFRAVRALLDQQLGLSPDQVSIIPGNHDVYTQGAARAQRFESFFAPNVTSDLKLGSSAAFPFVRLRGELAILGLSSAVVRPPFMAAGLVPKSQRDAITRALERPEIQKRARIFLLHHPLHPPPKKLKAWRDGLHEAQALIDVLGEGIVLHGHLHRRIARNHAAPQGSLRSFGATSASLDHEDADRMAGVNLYDFNAAGALLRASARVLGPGNSLLEAEIPEVLGPT
jgi:3',5'-cyclic AMP phosphodiesterase CpdA